MGDGRQIDVGRKVHERTAGDEGDGIQVQDERIAAAEAGDLAAEGRADVAGQAVAGERFGDERKDFAEVDVGEHAVGVPRCPPRRPLNGPVQYGYSCPRTPMRRYFLVRRYSNSSVGSSSSALRWSSSAFFTASHIAAGSRCAPPGGSGMISSITPKRSRSSAVILSASAASGALR